MTMKKTRKMMKNSLLALLLCASAWAQVPPTSLVINVPLNPVPPTNCSSSIVGVPSSVTYYYWAVANYPAGQAVNSNNPIVVNNAPGTLSSGNYVALNCSIPASASSIDFLRTTTPSLSAVGTQSIAVATATNGSTTDIGSALTSYTFNVVKPCSANVQVNNRDYISPSLEWSICNGPYGPITGLGAASAQFSATIDPTLAQLNAGAIVFAGIPNHVLRIKHFFIVARGGAVAGCTDIRIGDSNFANPVMIDPVANLTQNTGNTEATSTITQAGWQTTPLGVGLGIGVYKTGSACTGPTSFEVNVEYTVKSN